MTPAEFHEAVLFARAFRTWAKQSWEEVGRDMDERIGRLIETDPEAARKLLREWHLELCRGASGDRSVRT